MRISYYDYMRSTNDVGYIENTYTNIVPEILMKLQKNWQKFSMIQPKMVAFKFIYFLSKFMHKNS